MPYVVTSDVAKSMSDISVCSEEEASARVEEQVKSRLIHKEQKAAEAED